MSDDPKDPNIDDLIGHFGNARNGRPDDGLGEEENGSGDGLSGDELIQKVRDRLSADQRRQAELELSRTIENPGPGILVVAGPNDFLKLNDHLGQRATLIPQSTLEDPFCDSMADYAAVILFDAGNLPEESDLLNRAEGKPVAVITGTVTGKCRHGIWLLSEALDSPENETVFQSLLKGEHPQEKVSKGGPRDSWVSPRERLDQEEMDELMEVYESEEPGTASEIWTAPAREPGANPLELIRILLEARSSGDSSAEAVKRWVEGEVTLHGWVEVTPDETEGPQVKAGGRSPGEVYRQLGDAFDRRVPIPVGAGEWGPFIGFRVENHWLGILPGPSPESRRSFWEILELLPKIENLMPIADEDGVPRVEDPEHRFERLLHSRIRSSERRGLLPGVLLLEFPSDARKVLPRLEKVIRATDWCEVSESRIWVLVDQPDYGAAKRLSSRIQEALPEVRGGGTIGACTGYVARQCMDRVKDLLRSSDQATLNFEEEEPGNR